MYSCFSDFNDVIMKVNCKALLGDKNFNIGKFYEKNVQEHHHNRQKKIFIANKPFITINISQLSIICNDVVTFYSFS